MSTHVFGIRHHGPGSARSLVAALDALVPDVVLVEGPPEAEAVLGLVSDPAMTPPVALLVYPPERPELASFYPMATFSPEWNAVRWASARSVPVRFCDLPATHDMAERIAERDALVARSEAGGGVEPDAGAEEDDETADASTGAPSAGDHGAAGEAGRDAATIDPVRDPIGALAAAAGYADPERFWEHYVEHRGDPSGVFEAIAEAMTELRRDRPLRDAREARREASMRRAVRQAEREHERVAVVVGAYHVPAILVRPPVKDDDALLRGLPKAKVEATWTPWSYARLALRAGYAAGVEAPGWYAHLWETRREDVSVRWFARVAMHLRERGLDASSASVIEATRLADALSALRGRPLPDLDDLREAALSVLTHGHPAPLALVRLDLETGGDLGTVPEATPTVPLQRDLASAQKSLRLKVTDEIKTLDLDLRGELDRARSRLLHRLRALDIPWGRTEAVSGKSGTFHEVWTVQWQPELAVRVIEASLFGSTVEGAASARLMRNATAASELPALATLLDIALLGELRAASEIILKRIDERGAVGADVKQLLDALTPLARAARYGTVRETPTEHLLRVVDTLFERAVVGAPAACHSLDDPAAEAMLKSITEAVGAISILDRPGQKEALDALLETLSSRDGLHGLLRGGCLRMLLDRGLVADEELARRARHALSPAALPADVAAWAEGLLRGGAQRLLHQDGVWLALDAWLAALAPDAFETALPLVRRAFSGFERAERRAMGTKVRGLGSGVAPRAAAPAGVSALAPRARARAQKVLPVLSTILGIDLGGLDDGA